MCLRSPISCWHVTRSIYCQYEWMAILSLFETWTKSTSLDSRMRCGVKREEKFHISVDLCIILFLNWQNKKRDLSFSLLRERVIINVFLCLSFEPEFVVTSRWILIRFLYLFSLGDIQYDLEEAAQVRMKLVKMYETVDILRLVILWTIINDFLSHETVSCGRSHLYL